MRNLTSGYYSQYCQRTNRALVDLNLARRNKTAVQRKTIEISEIDVRRGQKLAKPNKEVEKVWNCLVCKVQLEAIIFSFNKYGCHVGLK